MTSRKVLKPRKATNFWSTAQDLIASYYNGKDNSDSYTTTKIPRFTEALDSS